MESKLSAKTFGELFRLKRLEQRITLRSFCEKYGYDPGNISRLERGMAAPSAEAAILAGYAKALKIPEGSSEWVTFFDLAHTSKGMIPPDIKEDGRVLSMLPAFYRTIRGEKLSKKKIQQLLNLLAKNSKR